MTTSKDSKAVMVGSVVGFGGEGSSKDGITATGLYFPCPLLPLPPLLPIPIPFSPSPSCSLHSHGVRRLKTQNDQVDDTSV